MHKHFSLTLMMVMGSLLLSTLVSAEESISQAEIETRLKALEAEILNYKEALESTQGQKTEVEKTLESNEKGISDLIKNIEAIEKEMKAGDDKVSSLKNEQQELLTAKLEQQHYIERQIRAAYEIGNQAYLKVLLNQEDPAEIDRMLSYYDYFNLARAKQVMTYNQTIVELQEISTALNEQLQQLEDNRQSLKTEEDALTRAQDQRRRTLTLLVDEIQSAGNEISRLETDRSRLEQLLDRLTESLANIPTPGNALPFSSMRGKLTLPAYGTITHGFGQRRNDGKLRWNGVFIDAPLGQTVHAVHYGRVVFSDWLRGFGLLLIISHGEGYMSLYGHNQTLYRETGDWVSAGEVIATVGDSGGQDKTGLYFEIRTAGKPSNPQQWCVARQKRAA